MHSAVGERLAAGMTNIPDGTGILSDIIELQDCMYGAGDGLSGRRGPGRSGWRRPGRSMEIRHGHQ